jgi:hypothetical protein
MNAVVAIIGAIAGCGILAALAMWLTGRGDKKSNILKALHEATQDKGKKELEVIEKKQRVVEVDIKAREELAEESRSKIKDIQKKAATEINEVLLEDSLLKIQDEIDRDWDDL